MSQILVNKQRRTTLKFNEAYAGFVFCYGGKELSQLNMGDSFAI
jgi:hypothetical protein